MTRHIALFGGSFNPPGLHHRQIAERLAAMFDEVIVVPCGPRPDKPATGDLDPVHRAAMVDMTFRGLQRVRVELADLENDIFTPAHELERRFGNDGTVWHVVTADYIKNGGRGDSAIERDWAAGKELWSQSRFAVVKPRSVEVAADDLPPQHRLVEVDSDGQGLELRAGVFQRKEVNEHLPADVANYIDRHALYRGAPPRRHTQFTLRERRFALVVDESSDRAKALAAPLFPYVHDHPEMIVVVGGDGTMLGAIREHWRRRLPLFGLNAGHLGFLLNEESPLSGPLANEPHQFVLEHLPLLHVEVEDLTGKRTAALAFNDAWVERASGQTAWIEVRENGHTRLEQLVGDGALVATAAGSTAYARAMGATPLPLGTPAVLLVGSNIMRPISWRSVVLPLESKIELRTIDENKRPLAAFIDGVPQGNIRSLTVRVSRVAAVELAFHPDTDLAEKLAKI
ncbi:MAG: NAD(+)/NADH kinase, partial [Planctomycetia bacterium]|nr:NAD(+)/NADH kinase [Planctomycetia bacterium]